MVDGKNGRTENNTPKRASWLGDRLGVRASGDGDGLSPSPATNDKQPPYRGGSGTPDRFRNHRNHHQSPKPSPTSSRTPQPPPPKMERKKNNWLFTKDEIFENSPTIISGGKTIDYEIKERARGINAIIKAGSGLKVTEIAINTACLYFHRFYLRYSLTGHHYYEVAGAALLLATKITECHRKLKDFAIIFTKIALHRPDKVVDEQSEEYWKWRNALIAKEEMLLEALCFDLNIDDPYYYLKDILTKYDLQDQKYFYRSARGFINDACRTIMYLIYPAQTLVCAAIYWSSIVLKTPVESGSKEPFWEHYNLKEADLIKVCDLQAEFYSTLIKLLPGTEKECQLYQPIPDIKKQQEYSESSEYDTTNCNTPNANEQHQEELQPTDAPSKRKSEEDTGKTDPDPNKSARVE